jgi:hypothetical protein
VIPAGITPRLRLRHAALAALTMASGGTTACSLLVGTDDLTSGREPLTSTDHDHSVPAPGASASAPGSTRAARGTTVDSAPLDAGDGPANAGDSGSGGAPNLFANGSFENGTCAPWTVTGGTLAISTASARHGHASCRWCMAGSGPVYLSTNANFAAGLEDGDQLVATLWVRRDTPAGGTGTTIGGMGLRLANDFVYDGRASNPLAFDTQDGWQSMNLIMPITDYQGVVPPAKVDFRVEWDNAAAGTCLLFDDLSLVRTPR